MQRCGFIFASAGQIPVRRTMCSRSRRLREQLDDPPQGDRDLAAKSAGTRPSRRRRSGPPAPPAAGTVEFHAIEKPRGLDTLGRLQDAHDCILRIRADP